MRLCVPFRVWSGSNGGLKYLESESILVLQYARHLPVIAHALVCLVDAGECSMSDACLHHVDHGAWGGGVWWDRDGADENGGTCMSGWTSRFGFVLVGCVSLLDVIFLSHHASSLICFYRIFESDKGEEEEGSGVIVYPVAQRAPLGCLSLHF